MMTPTYLFEGNKVYALVNGRVVASADDLDALEDQLDKDEKDDERPFPPKDHEKNEDKGDDKEDKGDDKEDKDDDDDDDDKKKKSTHIVTPNGLKGQILGRVDGLWEEEITVRFENGRIAHLKVSDVDEFTPESEAQVNPIEALIQRLNAETSGDRESLGSRQQELEAIRSEARDLLLAGAKYEDEQKLDELMVQADHELGEINDRVEFLNSEDAQAFAPPAPFDSEVVEQESLGGGDSTWLDETLNDMIGEANEEDYGRIMDEGPEAFVAELETPALADSGTVQQMASSWVRNKTAATDPIIRAKFEKVFLARIEQCRKTEIANRVNTTTKKEAARTKDEFADLPDDMLFS